MRLYVILGAVFSQLCSVLVAVIFKRGRRRRCSHRCCCYCSHCYCIDADEVRVSDVKSDDAAPYSQERRRIALAKAAAAAIAAASWENVDGEGNKVATHKLCRVKVEWMNDEWDVLGVTIRAP